MAGVRDRGRNQGDILLDQSVDIDDFANVMAIMNILGTWTALAQKSSSAITMAAALWMRFKWKTDENTMNVEK